MCVRGNVDARQPKLNKMMLHGRARLKPHPAHPARIPVHGGAGGMLRCFMLTGFAGHHSNWLDQEAEHREVWEVVRESIEDGQGTTGGGPGRAGAGDDAHMNNSGARSSAAPGVDPGICLGSGQAELLVLRTVSPRTSPSPRERHWALKPPPSVG